MAANKTFIDYFNDEEYARYNELMDMATEAKKNAPKEPRKPRGPMTIEQKIASKKRSFEEAQKDLEALLAAQEEESTNLD